MGINNFKVHVSIYGQKLLSVIDWASAASYNAVPVGVANVQVEGLKTLVNPHLSNASRDGWHTIKKVRSEATDGNNAMVAIVDDEVRRLPAIMPTSITNEYDLPFDPDKSPRENGGAAVTNAFYVTNMAHDIFHRYGFVEYAGGLGNDSVQVVVQNEEVGKNAFFITHADGKHGIMALGLLKEGDKQYDTAFDNDVLMHELTHGLSKRLVGGPANPDCLSTHESKSMGEGWSDFVAMWVRMKETDDDHTQFKLGTYVKPGGIRKLPYALSKEANEATYSFFNKWGWGDIHDTGIIWGNILYQMQRNIHNTMKRFSNDIRTASLEASNTYTMQLIVSAMQLSPCNPTFIQGREALIMADQTLTDGKYRCEIYTAFAKRGVGIEARREGFFDIVKTITCPATVEE
ncbi:peptidase M36 [Syncephalis plumigaleata]|nr:peptidase M36 [Syncephalis plumigaleata]